MENFKDRLIEAMNRAGMKPIDLALKTGIGKSSISQYMSGRCKAKQEALHQLSLALGVTEAWLMGYDVPLNKPIVKTPAQELNEITQSLTDADVQILIDMARRMIK